MGEKSELVKAGRGLSGGVLAVVFFVCVGVCAAFFSLGVLVGYNEKSSKAAPVTERVTASPRIPPTVNPPLHTPEPQGKEAASSSSSNGHQTPEGLPRDSIESLLESKPSATSAKNLSPVRRPRGSALRSGRTAESPASGEVDMGLTVQVAASRVRVDAEALVKILKTHGYPVFLMAPERAKAGDKLFRVQVGPFTSLADAEKVRAKLAQEGFKPFVRR